MPTWLWITVPESADLSTTPTTMIDDVPQGNKRTTLFWVAVKELKLSYYIGETLLSTIYIYYPL